MASICQIGMAKFVGGVEVDSFVSLVNPLQYFDTYNVRLHGIEYEHVQGAPYFSEIYPVVEEWLSNTIAVCHTHFDRVSLGQACEANGLLFSSSFWLDSAMMARRTWREVATSGYGLRDVADMLGIEFRHHDALEDARAAGQILLAAMSESGMDLAGCFERCSQPLSSAAAIRHESGKGPLAKERIVFTGSLTIPRVEAADLANSFGAAVDTGVTKHTTMLVVGDTDVIRLRGAEKSNKHQKAEKLIAAGQPIRIVRETDFARLCDATYLASS
ncbi:MAG: transposase [Sphingobium sp.]|nr:MAG: transposase [Sphingobium sp.]